MFERRKYLIQEIEELRRFLRDKEDKCRHLEKVNSTLISQNEDLKRKLNEICKVVSDTSGARKGKLISSDTVTFNF